MSDLQRQILNELAALRQDTDGRLSRIERHLGLIGDAEAVRHVVSRERAERRRSQDRGLAQAERILQRQQEG